MEGKIRKPHKIDAENSNVQAPFSLPEQFANCTGFKKKEKSNGGHMKIGTVLYALQFSFCIKLLGRKYPSLE